MYFILYDVLYYMPDIILYTTLYNILYIVIYIYIYYSMLYVLICFTGSLSWLIGKEACWHSVSVAILDQAHVIEGLCFTVAVSAASTARRSTGFRCC